MRGGERERAPGNCFSPIVEALKLAALSRRAPLPILNFFFALSELETCPFCWQRLPHVTDSLRPMSTNLPPSHSLAPVLPGTVLRLRRAFVLSLLLSLATFSASAATVQVSLDRDAISVSETATLTLTLEGATPRSNPNFQAPVGLKILPSGQSTSVSFINGRQSMQLSLTYTVEALREGNYAIPSTEFATDAGNLRTRPLALKVSKASAPDLANAQAYLQLVPRKKEVFLGESLPLEIQLYVEEGRLQQAPQLIGEGFTFSRLGDQPAQTRTRINNRAINLVTFRAVARAVKSGSQTIGPVSLQMELPTPGARSDFFGFRATRSVRVTAEPVTVQVLPLPPGAPADYTGAVGSYQMQYSAGPRAVTTGDPITLKIQITGNGMIDGLSLPKLDGWKGFKFYPPNARTELTDPMETSGTRFFEQVVVPQTPEIQSLPAFTWSYFDPETKSYQTLKGDAISLQVAASAAPNAPTPTLATNGISGAATPTAGLLHIRPQLGLVTPFPTPLWQSPWLLGLQVLPIGLWGKLRLRRWQNERLERNPRLKRRSEAERQVSQGLQELRKLASEGKSDAFFATLTRVLRCQIGERLDVPESALTESVVEERLKPHGLSDQDAVHLEELFHLHNQFRYAAQTTSAQLEELVPRVEQTLQALKSLPG